MVNVAALRREYQTNGLLEQNLSADPMEQFHRWMKDAVEAELPDPNAMTLCTIAADGAPDGRVVLLKGLDTRGFSFFTNRQSDKARQLATRPDAALVFVWLGLERQVRVRGTVSMLSRAEDEDYFRTRPRGSQLGAWASPQSSVVTDRAVLEESLRENEARFDGKDVPCPPHWGGYVLSPHTIEFWQGRANRLHDRIRFKRAGDSWLRERLGS